MAPPPTKKIAAAETKPTAEGVLGILLAIGGFLLLFTEVTPGEMEHATMAYLVFAVIVISLGSDAYFKHNDSLGKLSIALGFILMLIAAILHSLVP